MAATSSGNGGALFGPTRSIIIAFFVAFFWGGFVMYALVQYSDLSDFVVNFNGRRKTFFDLNNPYGHVHVDNTNRVSQEELMSFQSHTHEKQYGQDVVADNLYKEVKILCWILSSPQNLKIKTIHVQATWTRRCNKVIFISSEEDPSFPTVKVEAPEGRDFLWKKTRGAFQYVYDHHLNDADWFLKADDDTYVVLENLRYMLADKDPQKPLFFGRKFKPYVKQGYMSGGAGYVLSKAAVILAVEKAFKNPSLCRSESRGAGAAEDVEMGKCLENVGVIAGDSRDAQKRERFHPFIPEHHLIPEENEMADGLFNGVRVLCMIITSPQNLQLKTSNIKATWGRRCNKIVYISSHEDPTFPTVKVDVPEGRDFLWQKERGAFQYIYDHHLNDADWFLKADDDTYIIVENLRYLLASFNPNKPMYFGCKFKNKVKQGYMSGGAGYVMSRSALTLLVEKAFKNPDLCSLEGESEDVEMGRCLEAVGVVAGDSRDVLLRDRFHPFNPHIHLKPGIITDGFWFMEYVFYPTSSGPECCSDYSISFHYISPNTMYLLEYMIYHMRPFGIGHYTCPADVGAILKKAQLPADDKTKVESKEGKGQEVAKSKEKRAAVMLME